MKQFTLNLDKKSQRPTVVLGRCLAMLDTGASFPVWVDEDDTLAIVKSIL